MSYVIIYTDDEGATTVVGNFVGDAWASPNRARMAADVLNAANPAATGATVHQIVAADAYLPNDRSTGRRT